MAGSYIIVRHWRRFQLYGNRNPPWIKNYTRLLHDEDYLTLSAQTRAILHGLWLEYASSNAQLRLDTRSLSYRLRLRVTTLQLKRLEQGGWIEFAQTPRYEDVCTSRAREETETETKTEKGFKAKDVEAFPQQSSVARETDAVREQLLIMNGKPPDVDFGAVLREMP